MFTIRCERSLMETYSHDVIIVSAGIAGLRAAIATAETSKEIDVALISKIFTLYVLTLFAPKAKQQQSSDKETHTTCMFGTQLKAQTSWLIKMLLNSLLDEHRRKLLIWSIGAVHGAELKTAK